MTRVEFSTSCGISLARRSFSICVSRVLFASPLACLASGLVSWWLITNSTSCFCSSSLPSLKAFSTNFGFAKRLSNLTRTFSSFSANASFSNVFTGAKRSIYSLLICGVSVLALFKTALDICCSAISFNAWSCL